jgi:hypothetical protein
LHYSIRINRNLFGLRGTKHMGWITIFIRGNTGCGPDIMRQMEHSNIVHLPGTIIGEDNIGLYWVDEKTNLRDFKKAIGSKTIFKHRLRFFSSLEQLNEFYGETPDDSATSEEEVIHPPGVEGIQYKHSA